uniref:Diguanylate phosphodiesterase n=1 Tax=Rhodopseudomonas palustris (strain DX-1) TaxID=652103 RepID=E6VKS0_RHOPX
MSSAAPAPRPSTAQTATASDPSLLSLLGQATFVWDLASDALNWTGRIAELFQDIPAETLATGASYAAMLEPSRAVRSEALLNAAAAAGPGCVPYRIEYGIRASTSAPVCWIEETGVWFAGADGRPARVEGIVRINNERHARDEQLLKLSQHDPLTGELGLIRLVDHRVLELVVAELAAAPGVTLSLNISPDTTIDADWWAGIESLMLAHPGIAERLIVEITETVAIPDLDEVRGFVNRLKTLGAKIAIDDFGAGYTSFRNLRALGVDIVKIDGAFVQNIVRSADDRAFVQTLIDLARRLGIKTVAEWVQDEDSAQLLCDWGCDYIQGRLIGLASQQRPWPLAAGAAAASALGQGAQ